MSGSKLTSFAFSTSARQLHSFYKLNVCIYVWMCIYYTWSEQLWRNLKVKFLCALFGSWLRRFQVCAHCSNQAKWACYWVQWYYPAWLKINSSLEKFSLWNNCWNGQKWNCQSQIETFYLHKMYAQHAHCI